MGRIRDTINNDEQGLELKAEARAHALNPELELQLASGEAKIRMFEEQAERIAKLRREKLKAAVNNPGSRTGLLS